jgi:hypothetical protein
MTRIVEPSADERLAKELVERARGEGAQLVGRGGLLCDLTKTVLETALEVEMEDHVGYAKHAPEGRDKGNSHNGTRSKTVLTEVGEVESATRRDREPPSDAEIERGLRERAVSDPRAAEILLSWLQRVRSPEATPGVDLDAISEARLERLHTGLVRLATMDETVLAALVEHVLAGDEFGSS